MYAEFSHISSQADCCVFISEKNIPLPPLSRDYRRNYFKNYLPMDLIIKFDKTIKTLNKKLTALHTPLKMRAGPDSL